MIDTKEVADRRELRFESLDEAVRDAETLAVADAEGRLRKLGNWSLGEAVSHVAFWADAPFDGYPEGAKPSWFVRLVMRLMRGRLLSKGMMPGIRIPGAPGGTYGAEDLPSSDAAARLRAAFERLDATCPPDPNPLFGKMNHTQWKQLNLRHAELHFSFFHAE